MSVDWPLDRKEYRRVGYIAGIFLLLLMAQEMIAQYYNTQDMKIQIGLFVGVALMVIFLMKRSKRS